MQRCIYITLAFLLACCTGLLAQNSDVKVKVASAPDSAFIRSFDDYLNLTLTYNTHNMLLRMADADDARFIYSPNEIYETELSLSYSFLFVKYTFSPKFLDINNNENIKGATTRDDIEIALGLNRFSVEFEHSDTKGFYLRNTSDFDSAWQAGDPYILYPGMQVKQTGGSITYNANKHFAFGSLDGGTEQQLKTAFTFLPTMYLYYFRMRDEDKFVRAGEDEQSKSWDACLSLPVAANIVLGKSVYCAFDGGPCIGMDAVTSTLVDKAMHIETQKQTFATAGYTTRVSAGWGNRRFFAGIDASLRRYAHVAGGDDNLERRFYNASIYAGWRFAAPKLVKQSMEWVKKFLPFD